MKKILFNLIVLLAFSTITFAQKTLSSGFIKMEIVDISSNNPQVAMSMEMMKGTATDIYFNEQKTLTKMNMMGGMVEITNLYNNSTEKVDMLFNAMGQKMHIESTKEERDALEGDAANMLNNMKVEEDPSDTKTILGYKCVKVKVTNPSAGQGMSIDMYVAKDIKASSKSMQGLQNVEINGFPLETTINSAEPNMTMVMRAVDLKTEVNDKVFTLKTDGYQKVSMKDFQKMMGSMGGAMGF
jgi:hypothetical protein